MIKMQHASNAQTTRQGLKIENEMTAVALGFMPEFEHRTTGITSRWVMVFGTLCHQRLTGLSLF